jgi:hypothetical protein
MLHANIARLVCYLAREKEDSLRWHAHLGHLGFQGLRKMASEQWVCRLPKIEQVN